jgi:hypothetical protein
MRSSIIICRCATNDSAHDPSGHHDSASRHEEVRDDIDNGSGVRKMLRELYLGTVYLKYEATCMLWP